MGLNDSFIIDDKQEEKMFLQYTKNYEDDDY